MINEEKTYLFEEMEIPKAVWKLSIPMVISSIVTILYNLADTWFVGLLNNPVQSAAVTLASPVTLAFFAVTNLFGVGGSSMMSRALGRKDYDTARKSSAISIWYTIALSLVFSIVCTVFKVQLLSILGTDADNYLATYDYLFWTASLGALPSILNIVLSYLVRSEGASLHSSIGTMSGCLLNIILDPFFVLPFGLNMGAAGAGLATFISNCVACSYFFILLFIKRKRTYISLSLKDARFDKEVVKGITAVGIPSSIQNLLNVTGMTVMNNFASEFGTNAVSAIGIAYKVHMIPMNISFGMTGGIMPLISYNYGSKNYNRAKQSIVYTAKIAISFLSVVSVMLFVFSSQTISFFIKNQEVISIGSILLKGMSFALPFQCIDFLGVAVYNAFGKGKIAFCFAVLRKIILEIPFLITLNRLFPLYGLGFAQSATEFILSIVAVIVLKKIFEKLMRNEKMA